MIIRGGIALGKTLGFTGVSICVIVLFFIALIARPFAEHQIANEALYQKHLAYAVHLRQIAWDKAHPAQVAEDNRIKAIPFEVRLEHAGNELLQLFRSDSLINVNDSGNPPVVLNVQDTGDQIVVTIDNGVWKHLSLYEQTNYTTKIGDYMTKACSDNYACDPDNIHSTDVKSMGYDFTSYYDRR